MCRPAQVLPTAMRSVSSLLFTEKLPFREDSIYWILGTDKFCFVTSHRQVFGADKVMTSSVFIGFLAEALNHADFL